MFLQQEGLSAHLRNPGLCFIITVSIPRSQTTPNFPTRVQKQHSGSAFSLAVAGILILHSVNREKRKKEERGRGLLLFIR